MTIRSGLTTSRTLVTAGVGQQLLDPVEAVVEPTRRAEHLVAGHRQVRDPAEHGTDHAVHAPAHREDPLHVPGEDVGQAQQPDRLGRRRAVDDEHVPLARLGVGLDVAQGEHLVEPGHHRQLLGLDGLDPGPVEHLDQPVLDLAPGLLHPLLRVELLARQARGDHGRLGAERHVEAVGQRVGRVGRDDERAQAGVGAAHRRRRRDRRLAHASLAGEEEDAHYRSSVG